MFVGRSQEVIGTDGTLSLVKVQRSHGSAFDILLLKGLGDLISGDGHSPPQTIGAGYIKVAK